MGIDNARVEIDNLEVPILDGSGLPFVKLLADAGIKRLRRRRRSLRIVRTVEVEDKGKRITILPHETFRITCETDYGHPLAGRQALELDLTPEGYARSIAPARTFGFAEDLDRMRDMGLIRGATLANAICFNGSSVLNPGGLRFPDECCRHKVLDLIGDLALIGRPLLGHVIAEQAGHAMHAALVQKIMRDPTCYEVVTGEAPKPKAAEAVAQ
jgi:UDP-3-O-[3-hydroxymyristoyl] N-acetylglucosamine deacetylase